MPASWNENLLQQIIRFFSRMLLQKVLDRHIKHLKNVQPWLQLIIFHFLQHIKGDCHASRRIPFVLSCCTNLYHHGVDSFTYEYALDLVIRDFFVIRDEILPRFSFHYLYYPKGFLRCVGVTCLSCSVPTFKCKQVHV